MPDDVFIAINGDALHAKSKVYIGRALTRKGAGDLDEYQLWASLALELLGKAALARKHPSLVVDPTHWQSMFVAAGINVTTDVKTITAKTLFERLAHLVRRSSWEPLSFPADAEAVTANRPKPEPNSTSSATNTASPSLIVAGASPVNLDSASPSRSSAAMTGRLPAPRFSSTQRVCRSPRPPPRSGMCSASYGAKWGIDCPGPGGEYKSWIGGSAIERAAAVRGNGWALANFQNTLY